MVNHAEKLGISPKREPVLSIEDEGEIKVIRTKKNHYRTKSVILACGAVHRQLGIPGGGRAERNGCVLLCNL